MSTLWKNNQNTVSSQDELDKDIERLFNLVATDNILCVYIPGLTSLVYKLDERAEDTACTDGFSVFISEDYWNLNNDAQKIGLLFHEMFHCLYIHMYRFLDAENHLVANIACDIVINRNVKELSRYSSYIALPANPPGGEIIFTDEYGDVSEEIIYNKLLDEERKRPKPKGGGGGKGGQGPLTKYKGPGNFMDPPKEPQEAEEGKQKGKSLKEKWAQTQQSIAQAARLRGSFPGKLVEQLEKTRTNLDWLTILQRFLLDTSANDVSEEFFDRRFLGDDLFIEAIDSPQVSDIVFAKDTSGSMHSLWLSQTCSEIESAMQKVKIKRCWLLDIDSQMNGVIKEHGPNDPIDFSAKGRGGTDFRPPFRWAKEKCPTQPKALIYFTDGWGPFPEEAPPYPVLWMTFGEDPESYPFGTVIDMREVV